MVLFSKRKVEIKPGNKCLYLMFVGFNFLIFLASLGIFACSIYLIVIMKGMNAFNATFLVASIVIAMLTICSFRLRESVHMLGCYLFL